MRPTIHTDFDRELARVALERRGRADMNTPRPSRYPAMDAAVAATEYSARRYVISTVKSRAREYLKPELRWQLDMLWDGLSSMCPAEAFRILDRCALLPSYGHRTARINIRAARLGFRFIRRRQRIEEVA